MDGTGVSGTPLEPDLAAQINVFAIDGTLTQLHTLQERLKLATCYLSYLLSE